MIPFLRFLMLASLVVWLGGIVFFAAAVAPTLFRVLPTRELAGAVVTRALATLHMMGIVSGIVFAASSMLHSRLATGYARPLALRHLMVYGMIALTLVSQFVVTPKMAALRAEMVEIDAVPQDDPRRIEFNRLHQWSTRLEGAVLLLGIGVLLAVARLKH